MKRPNVIIEGCDGVGKTTLIEELLLTGYFDVAIKIQPPKSIEEGEERYINVNNLLNKHEGILLDRSMLSEKVYGPILRGYYPYYVDKLEKELENHNYLFLITAEPEIVKKRYDGKVITAEQVYAVISNYISEYKESSFPNKYLLDSSDYSPKELSDMIIQILKNKEVI
jgi:thymidylate kinase